MTAIATRPPSQPRRAKPQRGGVGESLEPMSRVALTGVVSGGLATIDSLPGLLRLACVLGFVGMGPGAALLVWWSGLSRPARVGVPPALGLALIVLAQTVSAFAKWWHPEMTIAAFGAVGVLSVLVRYGLVMSNPSLVVSRIGEPTVSHNSSAEWRRPASWFPPVFLVAAAVSWVIALPTIGTSRNSPWGLLVSATPAFVVSIALVGLAGITAIAQRRTGWSLGSAFALVVVERLTVSFATSAPLYPWTYKHIAVADYIDRYHYVVRGTDVYHDWPGLFAATAWLHDLTSLAPLDIAHWYTPVYHLALVSLFYFAARAWRRPPVVAAAATFVFEACLFLAQDYFSPQSLGYLFGLAVLLLFGESSSHRVATVPLLVIFGAVTVSHQLSPYWLIITAAGLVLGRRLRPFWIPVAFAAIAGSYLLWNYSTVKDYGVVTSPNPFENIRLTQRAEPLIGIQSSFYATIFLYLILFVPAGLGLLVQFRRHLEWRAPAALVVGPLLLLVVQGYGGEAVFRIFLYALPALSVISAQLLLTSLRWPRPALVASAATALVVVLASAHSYLGSFSSYRVNKSEVEIWDRYNRTAPVRSFFYSLAPGFPGNPTWQYASRITQSPNYFSFVFDATVAIQSNFASDRDYQVLVEQIRSTFAEDEPLYLVLSDRNQVYAYQNGILKAGTTTNLRRHISADARWRLVDRKGTTELFRFVG